MSSPVFEAFFKSDFLGKVIYLSLISLSVLSWVIIIYKMKLSSVIERAASQFQRQMKKYAKFPLNVDMSHLNVSGVHPNPFMTLYKAVKNQAFDILKKNKALSPNASDNAVFLSSIDIEQIDSYVERVIYTEKKKLEKYLFVLSIIFTLAPLLGLLGTVWGISVTFSHLPGAAGAMSNEAVLSGLAMALGTTVLGLFVTIPALIFFYYLKHRIEDHADRMDQFSSDILHNVEMQYRAVSI